VAGRGAAQAVAERVQVADGIEDLVLDELVAVTQPILVEYPVIVHHHGIVEAAAERQLPALHPLEVAHEAEGTGAAHFLDEGGGGEIDGRGLIQRLEQRVVEVDGEIDLEAFVRLEGAPLVAVFDADRLLDPNEALERILLVDAGRTDQEYERT